jgi:putative FmdB family regulatory protein
MPTYEYQCEKCKRGFEFFQSMKDEPLKVCPKEACLLKTWGKGKVKRQLGTGAGLIFKGSGFYITDYRSESYKAAAKSDSSSASGASGGADSGSSKAAGSGGAPTPAAPAKSSEPSKSSKSSKPSKDA